jgi:predicted permease
LDWLRRDLSMGLRLLARDRGFSLTTVVTLALCLGANTALFSIVHHVLLRPLPVPDSDRILLMANAYPKAGAGDPSNSGVPDYFDRLRETSVFAEQALFNRSTVSLEQDGVPTRVRAVNATPSFFRLMEVSPALGRPFTEPEGELGNEKKVILSDGLWRRLFAGDPSAIGKDLRLDGEPYTVVGVMPRSFSALEPEVALFRPLAFTAEQKSDNARHSNNWYNLGRLKPGATLEQAQAQVDALNAANLDRFPQYKELLVNAGFHTVVMRYQDYLVKSVKATLYLLWGGAFFVLLIGCVNVANLVLVRTRARLKELATRLALGAGPLQVARQLVVEGTILALAVAAAGLGVAVLGLQAVSTFGLDSLPHASEIRLDAVAALYAVLLALGIGLMIGLLPVASVLRARLAPVLREEGRTTTGGRGARALRRTLVVTQVAFTFVLLLGAGLLLASFGNVLQVDPGFRPQGVLTASVMLPRARYGDDDARRAFTDETLRRLRALPGVEQAGATDIIPLGGSSSDSVILAEGYQMRPGESVISPFALDVTPGYFEAMGARLLKGRFFTDADGKDSLPVIMVDEKLARRFWPGQDPVGRRMYKPNDINDLLAITKDTVFYTVVGVVGDMKVRDLTEGREAVGAYYFPVAQDTSRALTFAIKAKGRPDALASGVRGTIASIDRELPVYDVRTMEERLDSALLNRRSPALLSLSFGALALLLSAVGIYGVLAYVVTLRAKEFGIRIALGSTTSSIFRLVIREGAVLLAVGFALGAAGALLLRRGLESQLFGVGASDPRVVAGATLLLGLVALAACALPARRATRTDPRIVLTE